MTKFLIYYFLFLVFLLSIFISGVPDSQDALQYLAVARNIYYTGKPTAPVYEYLGIEKNIHMSTYVGKDGNTYSPTGLGFSLAMVPAVALTDIFYKLYGVTAPYQYHFPLENDWLIFLTASFVNIFFGAMLGVILFIFLKKLGLNSKQSLFLNFTGIFATNLFIYSKHTMAHMMFTSFLFLTFLLLKIFSEKKQRKFLIFAGLSFGVLSITYNPTFILSVPVLMLYYILLLKPKISFEGLKTNINNLISFLIGFLPFILIFFWFEGVRAESTQNLASYSFFTSYAGKNLTNFPISVLIEGLFGQLFSPGRSIFLYSPILLIIVFFWHKLKPLLTAEMIVFLVSSFIYIIFYSIQYTYGGPVRGYAAFWHGESSWGPRYLVPLLPFGILIVGQIFRKLRFKEKLFFFYPLLIVGFYVNFLGIIIPYQVKFQELERNFYINGTEFTVFTYSNLIPRFSPVFMMSKKFVKNIINYPKTLDHGKYNVKFYDGIGFPFNVGGERWRSIEGRGSISFDNNIKDPVKIFSFGLINHPIGSESSGSAQIQFNLNNHPLLKDPVELKLTERNLVEVMVDQRYLKNQDNRLIIEVNYIDNGEIKKRSQILGLINFFINGKPVNMESLDFPYYSPLGPAMVDAKYGVYGGTVTNPWRFWDLHTQIYERTPDFWWMRTLYYWDYPQKTLTSIFIVTVLATTFFGYKTLTSKKN